MDDLKEKLATMSIESDEYFAMELYKNKLAGQVFKCQKKILDILDQGEFLHKLLKEIFKSSSASHIHSGFCLANPNYELLSNCKFNEMEKLDFSFNNASDQVYVGKHCTLLHVKRNFTSHDIISEAYQKLQGHQRNWKIIDAQREIFKKSKLIYCMSTKTEHNLDLDDQVFLKLTQRLAEKSQKTVIGFLREQIEDIIAKVERIYIPELAPTHLFAKTVKAFCEEIDLHQLTK